MREEPIIRFARNGDWRLALLVSAVVIAGCAATWRTPVPVRQDASRPEVLWALVPPAEVESPGIEAAERPATPVAAPQPTPAVAKAARGELLSIAHPAVDRAVYRLCSRRKKFIQRGLDRSGAYTGSMAAILREERVPEELVYVPLIESGFKTRAVSHKRAVGPWQFVRATGRHYGLRVGRYIDERRDPDKATRAAARYLRDLHEMFGSWPLALAAYNTGERRIRRNLARYGPMTYWEMRRRGLLHRETRDYVPAVLGAIRIGSAPEKHGFLPPSTPPLRWEEVKVFDSVALSRLARMVRTTTRTLRSLNPALARGVTPPGRAGYRLRLPVGTGKRFRVAYRRWERHRYVRVIDSVEPGPVADRVRKGDNPSKIAQRLGVSVAALMYVNGWTDPRRLVPGQAVRVPRPKQGASARGVGASVSVAVRVPADPRVD